MTVSFASRTDGPDLRVLAELRRQRTLSLLRRQGYVRVAELAAEFGISDTTVRADLNALDELGVLRRVHGGAVSAARAQVPPPARNEPPEPNRPPRDRERTAIAAAAAALVRDGESVILDVGSTTTATARALVARTDLTNLTVFTNSLNVALALEPALLRFTVVDTSGTAPPAH